MEIATHIAAVRDNGARLADAAQAAGLDRPVPTCPGWQVRDLLRHTGGVHRWAASYVTTGRDRAATDDEVAEYFAAPADDGLVGWFKDGHAALVEALSSADPGLTCWTFLPDATSPLGFWARRQAHETTIHRIDAELAEGARTGIAPALAADGIGELFSGFYARPRGRLVSEEPVSLAVRATDADAAWTMRIGPGGREISRGTADADCTVSGPAAELYLLLWNRGGAEGLTVQGDREVLDLWRERATIRWSSPPRKSR